MLCLENLKSEESDELEQEAIVINYIRELLMK